MANKVIMAWSKCKVEFGATATGDVAPTTLTDVGYIKNQTTELSTNDGDTLQAVATGGEVVAEEALEGTLELSTTVIEPSAALYKALGISTDGLKVKTHIVPGDQFVQVTPHNVGAMGIKCPVTRLSVAPAFDEKDGNALKLTFKVFKTTALEDNYWYERFASTGLS
jgi:hypothetical protein